MTQHEGVPSRRTFATPSTETCLPHEIAAFDIAPVGETNVPFHLAIAIPRTHASARRTWIPPAARAGSGRIAAGRGLTREQAFASCRGETVELISACQWGGEPTVSRPYGDGAAGVLHPAALLLASDDQYRARCAGNARYGAFDWLPRRFDVAETVAWVEAVSPDGRDRALVPAACIYLGWFEAGDDRAFAVADSNGCAAAHQFEEAVVAGFLELVERDATALWWYGGHRRPGVDMASIAGADALLAWLAHRDRRTSILDLTTDLGISVRAALSADRHGRAVAVGAAARFDPDEAAIAALTEMLQIESMLAAAQSLPVAPAGVAFWLDTVSLGSLPHLVPCATAIGPIATPPVAKANHLDACLRISHDRGLRLLTVDLTRPGVGLCAVRVVVPGLRPIKARFAPGRLFDVPAALGWCEPSARQALNTVPLAI